MNVLIIHAHPEPCSFNGAMTRTAVRTLTRLNHEVRVSDLYAMGWNAVLQAEDFSERVDGHFFDPAKEQAHAQVTATVCSEVKAEQDKVAWAELVIFQFPMWWFSMPAMLKGWVDRVLSRGFAYSTGRKYDTGHLKGKCAMLSLTTGTASTLYAPNGIDGDLHHILWPIHNGILAYTGFTVLPPFAAWMPAQVSQQQRADYLLQYAERLSRLGDMQPLFFHPRQDYDEHQQLKPGIPARSGVQWNPRAGQTFEASASKNFDSAANGESS
ncbi:TPA: NAD(P)H-dependent oxidoreductase [Pseudomonas putida]|uniref:NAD(P)H-dependent oxidoreductase n=1 Tax=Pseudomonas putida TaxID=303 RepID=A0AAW6PTH0_PSEPU|nr:MULTISPECIES: NAD(P)H-dependent oxidoreductase [Pseudomonas]ELU0816347.1 NAD(P)H-dependent oxidoreductase [Pseudomonas putida]MCE0878894.1 NAD(P)H-dependent oxidoreductase [Pseudomonas putida]MCE0959302.1 NAD(P)H-dependent oxidoreductase [Pseudomonas putida]MCE0971568.1 NAD(P)H-dependent oxidoreductase [Pseudomonas putida]MDD2116778.1 NAD(P)H-dependent oxidoreductase [Pseudomonas putida]